MLEYVKDNCTFCTSQLKYTKLSDYHDYCFFECPVCGNYEKSDGFRRNGYHDNDKIASYLYYKGNTSFDYLNEVRCIVLSSKEYFDNKHRDDNKRYRLASPEVINSFYPQKFSERIDKILLCFAALSEYVGAVFTIDYQSMLSAMFIKRYNKSREQLRQDEIRHQLDQVLDYLVGNKYIDVGNIGDETKIQILPEGWKRIDELQKESGNNKDVFVAMSFAPGTLDTREAIRNGIINAGYSPEFIDEIIHNEQIVPEMFRLIRESRFLILDISDPNYGAYYEAGYALGLGKEVIICCRQEAFNKTLPEEEKKYEKYLRPHFDIAQKQILVWNNYEDLTKKLEEWIKAIIG